MIGGTLLLALAALMLYQGFTGKPVVGEIQKLLAGEAAFTTDGKSAGSISVGGVQTNPTPVPAPSPGSPGGGGGGRPDRPI